jgi:antitoxin MazE
MISQQEHPTMQVRVSRWGNSLAVRLPKQLAEQLGLTEGQTVDLAVVDNAIKIEAEATPRIPRYKLADLLADCDPNDQPDVVEWGPDIGAEIIDDDYSRGLIREDK